MATISGHKVTQTVSCRRWRCVSVMIKAYDIQKHASMVSFCDDMVEAAGSALLVRRQKRFQFPTLMHGSDDITATNQL